MKFDEAVYRHEGIEEIIALEEIPRRENFLEIIQNIYCPDQHCEAKLTFNRKATGKNYMCKHKSFEHDVNCMYYEEEIKPVKSVTEYVEVNGNLTDKGKKRRKKEAMKALREYLRPTEVKSKKTYKKSVAKKQTNDATEIRKGIKVNYDPSGEIVQEINGNGDIRIKEPPFYERLPHQLSVRDSGENLRTSAVIQDVIIFDSDNPKAEIKSFFGDIKITFVMPEPFFVGNERRLQKEQLVEYLKLIKDYVKENPKKLYLTTMCQSEELDMENILLNVLDPDFMSFQTEDKDFDSLTIVIAAITTGVI
ncbi:TPA: hypothetical protein ACQK7H_001092 [Enterococcus faecalis]